MKVDVMYKYVQHNDCTRMGGSHYTLALTLGTMICLGVSPSGINRCLFKNKLWGGDPDSIGLQPPYTWWERVTVTIF